MAWIQKQDENGAVVDPGVVERFQSNIIAFITEVSWPLRQRLGFSTQAFCTETVTPKLKILFRPSLSLVDFLL